LVEAISAAKKLKAANIPYKVINVINLTHLDSPAFQKEVKGSSTLITAIDAYPRSLWRIVMEAIRSEDRPKVEWLGVDQAPELITSAEEIYRQNGLDADSLFNRARLNHLTYQISQTNSGVVLPYSVDPEQVSHNEALLLIKPTEFTAESLNTVFGRLNSYGYDVVAARVLSAEDMRRRNLVATLYPTMAAAASGPEVTAVQLAGEFPYDKSQFLTPDQIELLKTKFPNGVKVGDDPQATPVDEVPVIPSVLLTNAMGWQEISAVWSAGRPERVGPFKNLLPFQHPSVNNGRPFFILTGQFIRLKYGMYEAPGARTVAFVIRGKVPQDADSWRRLRKEIVGATDPTKAAEGSLRRDAYVGLIPGVRGKFDVSNNFLHTSDGPFAAGREIALFFEQQGPETSIGRSLAARGYSPAEVERVFTDPRIEENKTLFAVTEELNVPAAITKLLTLFPPTSSPEADSQPFSPRQHGATFILALAIGGLLFMAPWILGLLGLSIGNGSHMFRVAGLTIGSLWGIPFGLMVGFGGLAQLVMPRSNQIDPNILIQLRRKESEWRSAHPQARIEGLAGNDHAWPEPRKGWWGETKFLNGGKAQVRIASWLLVESDSVLFNILRGILLPIVLDHEGKRLNGQRTFPLLFFRPFSLIALIISSFRSTSTPNNLNVSPVADDTDVETQIVSILNRGDLSKRERRQQVLEVLMATPSLGVGEMYMGSLEGLYREMKGQTGLQMAVQFVSGTNRAELKRQLAAGRSQLKLKDAGRVRQVIVVDNQPAAALVGRMMRAEIQSHRALVVTREQASKLSDLTATVEETGDTQFAQTDDLKEATYHFMFPRGMDMSQFVDQALDPARYHFYVLLMNARVPIAIEIEGSQLNQVQAQRFIGKYL
jgi:nucleoside diphosphate kinase